MTLNIPSLINFPSIVPCVSETPGKFTEKTKDLVVMAFQSEEPFLRDQFNLPNSFAVMFYEVRRHRTNGWIKLMKAAAENYK